MTYVDCLHIYSIARAGYIPQLCSLRLPNPTVIFELLEKSNGKALIHDSSFSPILSESPVPTFVASDVHGLAAANITLPSTAPEVDGKDTLMIFHTSGSTSGRPKLVPCSYSWWQANLWKGALCTTPCNPQRQDVTVWMLVSWSFFFLIVAYIKSS